MDGRAPADYQRRVAGPAKLMRRSCGTCVNYDGDYCTLFEGMPVEEGDLCDEYERGRGKLLFGAAWLLVWSVIALLWYVVVALLL